MKTANLLLLGLGLLLPDQPDLRAQPVPHHFSDITRQADHTITLSLGGSVSNLFASFYDLYVIEASPNLTDWMPLATLVRTNAQTNPLEFTDTHAAQLDRRFYRTFTNHLITPFPKPTGPYAVGTFSRLVTDPSQTDRYGIENNSSFMVSFWYPAVAEAHLLPGAYLEMNLAKESAWASFGVDTRTMPHFIAHSQPEAAVLSGPSPFPVIIYSHGKNINRKMNTRTVEELASHGYLVVGIDHLDCYATQFPDGRYLYGSFSSFSAAITSRIKDVQFVLDELARMNAGNSPLAARMNLERIGLLGMSLGGAVAAEVGRTDPRIQCVALLDGALHFEVNTQLPTVGVGKPFLAMNNANDPAYNFWPDIQAIYSVATDNAISLRIKDSFHMWFSDIAWIASPSTTTRRAALAMDACTLSFFNHYLKDQDDHGFEASNGQPPPLQQAYPEIIELKTTRPVLSRYSILNHRSYQPANTTFSFRITSGVGVSTTTGLSLVVNGIEHIAQASVTGTAKSLNVSFSQFPANGSYRIDIKATDINGRVVNETRYLDTLLESNFTIEAEDFNYGGGQFIERAAWAPNLYDPYGTNYVGVQQVDCFEPSFSYTVDEGTDPNTGGLCNHEYRWADTNSTPPTGEWIATGGIHWPRLSQDQQVRQKVVTAVEATQDLTLIDYNIGETQVGEWWNYTRTFPAGSYKVYARLASGNDQGFTLNFYQIQGPANTENQVLTRVGAFHHPGSTGGSRSYWFFPLQDDLGQEVVLDLNGLTTVRGEVAAGSLEANFFMFVPASPSGN